MTTSALGEKLPFLLRFAKPILDEPSSFLRYDSSRQVTEVLHNDQWIVTPDLTLAMGGTRKTAVAQETTDDE